MSEQHLPSHFKQGENGTKCIKQVYLFQYPVFRYWRVRSTELWHLKEGGEMWALWPLGSLLGVWAEQGSLTQIEKSAQRLANQIQQYRKTILGFEQVGFIPGVEDWFDIPKSINAISHTNVVKEKYHLSISVAAWVTEVIHTGTACLCDWPPPINTLDIQAPVSSPA